MLDTQEFGDFLQSAGLRDFVGVPCSYLSPLINYAINENRFIMSNNEGDAVAIASGISLNNSPLHRKTSPKLHSNTENTSNLGGDSSLDLNHNPKKTYGIVLMQNSGLSNALSPLTSLNYTFKIPVLGFVSLRGERDCNGKNTDEPQHELLGVITDRLLDTCEISHAFLDSEMDRAKSQVLRALDIMDVGDSFFFIVRDRTFSKVGLLDSKHLIYHNYSNIAESSGDILDDSQFNGNYRFDKDKFQDNNYKVKNNGNDKNSEKNKSVANNFKTSNELANNASRNAKNNEIEAEKICNLRKNTFPTRLSALELIHSLALESKALLLATTGKCGRELYEIGDTKNQAYMVGSMGCVSALALGISLKTSQKVIAIDGDSALLMRLGALSTNAYYSRGNFCHILLDNESHDSTGGQFNLSPCVSFPTIARACGYTNVYEVQNLEELEVALKEFLCEDCVDATKDGQSVGQDFSILESYNLHNYEKNGETKMEKSISKDFSATKYDENAMRNDKKTKCELTKNKNSYFISLKISKGSKDNLGRPKITPQEVAERLSAYICEWREQTRYNVGKTLDEM